MAQINTDSLQIIFLEKEVSSLRDMVGTSYDAISNEISSVNTVLTVTSIVIAVVGIIVSVYITYLGNKVSQMRNEIISKEEKIKEIAKVVKETDERIQSDISRLYEDLKVEETRTLIKRLEDVPEDISNLAPLLLARELGDCMFAPLKKAYKKLMKDNESVEQNSFLSSSKKDSYLLLFCQHFMYLSLIDEDLKEDILSYFETAFNCAFRNDMEKSTRDMCKALNETENNTERIRMLKLFLKDLDKSKYKSLQSLKDIFYNTFLYKDELVDAIQQLKEEGMGVELFNEP